MENSIESRVLDILIDNNLNWSVDKRELFDSNGHKSTGFGMYRKDTNACLGVVGKKYTSYQNSQMAMQFTEACDAVGITGVRGGMLAGGSKVYLQGIIDPAQVGKDVVERYITALNSHDGSTHVGFGACNVTVVCQNTFYRAYKSNNMTKIKHSASVHERVGVYIQELARMLKNEQGLITNFQIMSQVPVTEKHLDTLFKKVFDIDLSKTSADMDKKEAREALETATAIRENGLNVHGNTLWGLFSGVTHQTTNVLPRKGKKMEYVMTGSGYDLSNTTYDMLLELIGADVYQEA